MVHLGVSLIVSAGVARAQSVWYVDGSAAAGGDGSSWASAFAHVQDAIDAAEASGGPEPRQVWIATGTYRPDRGDDDRSASFTISEPIEVYGSLPVGATDLAQRDPAAHPAVLTGDLGVASAAADNSFHVVVVDVPGPAGPRLDSLVIRDGFAEDLSPLGADGGGALVLDGDPVFVRCWFLSNAAEEGGGAATDSGLPRFEGCRFAGNDADVRGGGLFLGDGGTVIDSRFDDNSAAIGGGLAACCGPIEVVGSRFAGNFASDGGGLALASGSALVVACDFFSNAGGDGGGVFSSVLGAEIVNCRFGQNTSSNGGAVHLTRPARLTNCSLVRNTAFEFGGGVYAADGVDLVHCTAVSNIASFLGGGVYHLNGTSSLLGSILWGNTDASGVTAAAQISVALGAATADRCCVQGYAGFPSGVGNLSSPPMLADPAGADGVLGTADDDLSLLPASPCVDAGDFTALPADAADLDADGDVAEPLPVDLALTARSVDDPLAAQAGVPGPGGVVPDIGALERDPGCVADLDGDGAVDVFDFAALAANIGLDPATFAEGDVDGDGAVTVFDFAVLASEFGAGCSDH